MLRSTWKMLAVMLVLSACNLSAGIAGPTPTATIPPTLAPTLLGTVPAATPAPASPTAATAPVGDAPVFLAPIRFTTDPNAVTDQRVFPIGVQEIWAVWEYRNMREGLTVRRVWYHEGQVWLEREEVWDFATYGADGVMRDISVYDYEDGLDPGRYQLALFIDGQEQIPLEAADQNGFRIEEGAAGGEQLFPAPTGGVAILTPPGTLAYQVGDGPPPVLVETDEIAHVAWFPDGRHIVYSDVDRSQQAAGGGTVGIRYELWIVNVDTRETWQISQADEVLHTPLVSPDGRRIAALQGSGWFDAGFVDLSLGILTLDDSLRRTSLALLGDFVGIPEYEFGTTYPVAAPSWPLPGVWQGPTRLGVGLSVTMTDDPTLAGIYVLDMETMTASKIGPLEGLP